MCDNNAWREATTNEELFCRNGGLCEACTEARQGKFWKHEGNQFVCDNNVWRTPNCAELKTERLCMVSDSTVVWECEDVGNFKIDYICTKYYYDNYGNSKLEWHPVGSPYEYTLADWKKKKAEYYTAEKHPNAKYGEDLIDKRDGNVYRTIVMNGMRVFAENLRYADSAASKNLIGQTSCYNGESKNCEIGVGC